MGQNPKTFMAQMTQMTFFPLQLQTGSPAVSAEMTQLQNGWLGYSR
jgi:hypothetical protein